MVAGVVQVVRGDLALAFALAGIVAAVRFRTTVKDLQDAVFAFSAIGVGLAAGTGNFSLAGALSFIFCLLSWLLWQYNVGDVEPSLELGHSGVTLAEALVPGEGVVVSDTTPTLRWQVLGDADRYHVYVGIDSYLLDHVGTSPDGWFAWPEPAADAD